MYSLVFDSVYVKFCVFFLFTFLLLQPIAPAFASFDDGVNNLVSEVDTVVEESLLPDPSEDVVIATDVEVVLEVQESLEVTEDDELNVTEVIDDENSPVIVEGVVDTEIIDINDGENVVDESVIIEDVSTSSVPTEIVSTEITSTSTIGDGGETYSEIIALEDEDTDVTEKDYVASTSTQPQDLNVQSVQFSDLNRYQFGAQECVGVGDGAYYCSKTTDKNSRVNENSIYSARDAEGDLEIYITLNKNTVQLSDNSVEDGAPYYDALSETVVWHRLENGRHEIIQYDLKSGEEKYITKNGINDTEPTVSGEYIVWQRWVDDNWEIVLFDGIAEKQLTQNVTHDVAPHIKGGYVIWHATGQNGQTHIGVYEIETGLTSTIEDPDSGSVENPRFVLVYDTIYENGDVITKGYDFESKAIVPLSAVPYQLPSELPDPDSTGETRALIQNKSSNSKDVIVEDQVSNDPPQTGTSTPSLSNQLATSTSSTSYENATETSATLNLTPTSSPTMQLTYFDLVVTPYQASSSAQDIDSASSTNFVE